MKTIFIDTNVLARYLAGDVPDQGREVKALMERAENGKVKIYMDEVIVAESIWLFVKFYKMDKARVTNVMSQLLGQKFVVNPRKKMMLEALVVFRGMNLSYVDCWLKTVVESEGGQIFTFDKKLGRSK